MKWNIGRASDPVPKPSGREQERTDTALTCSCLALIVVAILGALFLLIYGVWYFFEAMKPSLPI